MSTSTISQAIDVIGRRQHGVVTREDLLAHGVPDDDVTRALERRQVVSVRRGVYVPGGVPLSWPAIPYADYRYLERQIRRKRKPGQDMPIVALTGVGDLALRGIGQIDPPETSLLVTNPPSRSTTVFHMYREDLRHDRVETVRGFTSTVLPWSLAEASDVLPTVVMQNTVIELIRDGDTSRGELYLAAEELGWDVGARLRGILDGLSDADLRTRSGRERRVLRGAVARGLPEPEINALLVIGRHRFEGDAFWRDARVLLEIDGPHHDFPDQKERDTVRNHVCKAAGIHVERTTIHDVDHDLDGVLDRIESLLAERAA